MSERLNANDYRLPVLDVSMAVALTTALLSAAPSKPPENVHEVLDDVRSALATLEQKRGERRVTPDEPAVDPRPVDTQVDNSWSALHDALASLAALPPALYPRSGEAAALLRAIFTTQRPLAFLRLRYAAEWSEVKAHLDVIDAQKLEPRIQKLLGPEFMAEIHRTFDLYGAALGITTVAPLSATPDSLLEPLRALTASLNDYVIAALGMVRRTKPGSRDLVAAALDPILRMRRPASTPASTDQPAQPSPEQPTQPSHS